MTTLHEDLLKSANREWGMFTNEGNKRISNYARTLANKAHNSVHDEYKLRKAVKEFIDKLWRLGYNNKFAEITDTEVRESIKLYISEVFEYHDQFNSSREDFLNSLRW